MVLGHEMGHAFARHTAERMGLRMMFGVGIIAVASLWNYAEGCHRAEESEKLRRQGKPVPPELEQPAVPSWVMELVVPVMYDLVVELPHSRRNEFEVRTEACTHNANES